MLKKNILFFLVLCFSIVSMSKASDFHYESPSCAEENSTLIAPLLVEVRNILEQPSDLDTKELKISDEESEELSPEERLLIPCMQVLSIPEQSPSMLKINVGELRSNVDGVIIHKKLNFSFYATALIEAVKQDDWLVIDRLNSTKANEQREEEFETTFHKNMYYFSNIIALTLCAKYNHTDSAESICQHLKIFYKDIKVEIGEKHLLCSFFNGYNHPLYIAQKHNNILIIKTLLNHLNPENAKNIIFPTFYEEVFWGAMMSRNVDFVRQLKAAGHHKKCNGNVQNSIEKFLKKSEL